MVELLFARGLVKVLFATETFAMVCDRGVSLRIGCEYACEDGGVFWDTET